MLHAIPLSHAGTNQDIKGSQPVISKERPWAYQEEGLKGGLDPGYYVKQAQERTLYQITVIQGEIERISRGGVNPLGTSVKELELEAEALLKEYETTPNAIDVEIAKLPALQTIADKHKAELNTLIARHKTPYYRTDSERLVEDEEVIAMTNVQTQLELDITSQRYLIWLKESNWRRRKESIDLRTNELEELKRTHGLSWSNHQFT